MIPSNLTENQTTMKILLPIDFSKKSKKALNFAISLAKNKNTSITILHVIEAVYDFAAQTALVIDGMHRDTEIFLKQLLEEYKDSGIEIKYLVKEGTVSIITEKTAKEIGADLIILSSKSDNGLESKLLGNRAIDIIKSSKTPVLMVPPKASLKEIKKITFALEFSDHEESFLDFVVNLSETFDLKMDFLHIKLDHHFNEALSILGFEAFIHQNFPDLFFRLKTYPAENLEIGLDRYLEKNEDTILVMCHQHRSLWDQILTKSKSIQMAYHTHVPLMILN